MLVLDANIRMRAVLGKGARALLAKYGEGADFVAPDTAFHEAVVGPFAFGGRAILPAAGFQPALAA